MDGQSVFFRDSGLHLRWVTARGRHGAQAALGATRAPRSLQVALTRRCNLRCAYCVTSVCSPTPDHDFWTHQRVLTLARLAHRWGVAEITFGGGEPLLFAGLERLLPRIWDETSLGVGFTTNGTLLTPTLLQQLAGRCGPIRVSVHPGIDWHAPVALLRAAGHPFGVNLLVTPALLRRLEQQVEQLEAAGVRDILFLRHHGGCPTFELPPLAVRDFDQRLARLYDDVGRRISLSVDRCWGATLGSTPRLFGSRDCGAGVDVLSLDADGRVAGCSFQQGQVLNELAGLPRLHRRLARQHGTAGEPGCGRAGDPGPEPRLAPGTYVWRAHACNNSAPSVLVARFARRELAGAVVRELREWLEIGEAVLFLDRPPESLPAVSDESIAVAARHEQAWDDPMPGGYSDNPIELALDAETLMLFNNYCLGFHDGIAAYLTDRGGVVRRPHAVDPPWVSVRLRLPDGLRTRADELHRFLHQAVEYQNTHHWEQGPRAPWQEAPGAERQQIPALRVGGHHRDGQVFLFNVGVDVSQLNSLRAWLGTLGADHELSLSDDTERHRIRALGAAACPGCGASPMTLLIARWTESIDEDQLACPGCGAMFSLDVVLAAPGPDDRPDDE